jgi:hypothetical protein
MKEQIILSVTLTGLGLFGFRGILPELSSPAIAGLFSISGLIGCCYHFWQSRNKRSFGMLAMSNK